MTAFPCDTPTRSTRPDLEKVTLKPLVGRVVRSGLEFRQANLFAFCGDWHFIDAQDLWLIEDGKPAPMKRFDNP